MGFAAFAGQKYLNLETFKKSGQGVKTPVWFAAEPSMKLDSNVAPCDMRGGLRGEWVPARVEILGGAEAQHGMQLLNKKYAPWKQLLDFFAMFRKRERTVFLIRPN